MLQALLALKASLRNLLLFWMVFLYTKLVWKPHLQRQHAVSAFEIWWFDSRVVWELRGIPVGEALQLMHSTVRVQSAAGKRPSGILGEDESSFFSQVVQTACHYYASRLILPSRVVLQYARVTSTQQPDAMHFPPAACTASFNLCELDNSPSVRDCFLHILLALFFFYLKKQHFNFPVVCSFQYSPLCFVEWTKHIS